ncbi:cob(I)yrinic acid a,c-diamide adenosyltransferase [Companilactobacillus halodurans]|uniref:Corrinoid adenosyltransferase n=1 Tax=Companilactobacillus halodurans TaxID=2584183 RepID=A0A5P0ZQI5_9LACO|nr:cob(I)yrinic acid a,c-diamide adenosyltransferase [Companilactobacillus halodurans]MQS76335.1 cob(I)yrinic acid a,c-diamide adenosyltransferase [Companilactobacillus halodurans]MQS98189.1 cob(I)yrinic acid a,c-diamide adenosyltransferase [Companilactobacillus halodurans]
MKIYTRTGDKGKTRIIGNDVLYKSATRINSYGTIDELNSLVGVIIANLSTKTAVLHDELEEIQQLLFDCGTDLAISAKDTKHEFIFKDDNGAVDWLEKKIDEYSDKVPVTKKFILPGGSKTASNLHLARTVTRRAEREIVKLMQEEPINEAVLKFINRLSDYFFAAARYSNVLEGVKDIQYRNSKPVFR